MKNESIDNGKAFDWGRTSANYAKFRDIYPQAFYRSLVDKGLCTQGQRVLDIGTGTGVLPRSLYGCGARFTGIDIAQNQIAYARELAEQAHMVIDFQCVAAEDSGFAAESFDTVTACQCFGYFDHGRLAPRIHELLRPGGRFAVMYMNWLPFEDKIAGKSEELILKYNPQWTGCGEVRRPIAPPAVYGPYFTVESSEVFDLQVPFTRESWHGRIKTCRGIEASLDEEQVERFDAEHRAMLLQNAPPAFTVLHYAAVTVLKKRA